MGEVIDVRPRILLPLINGIVLLFVATLFIRAHGGWKGDLGSGWSNDTVSEPEMTGAVLCNRWRLAVDREPVAVRGFLSGNVVAFVAAKLVLEGVTRVSKQFHTPYPYRVSYATYGMAVGIGLSFVQWFVIGILVEFVLGRLAGRHAQQPYSWG
jgi:hypothetical protein